MKKYLIHGGKQLNGEIEIERAKNSFLPILAGSILCENIELHKVPNFVDIENMLKILQHLGIQTQRESDTLFLNTQNLSAWDVCHELASPIRSSIFTMGALLAKFKKVKISYPGGCDIGLRPIDLHLKGLRELGVKIVEKHGYIYGDATDFKGGRVCLSFPSVGATENLIMASVLCDCTTEIYNCAKEPEIVDLQNFLNSAGASISGAGSSVIKIQGVEKLNSVVWTPIYDRIIAGTYAIASAICGGKVKIIGAVKEHNCVLFDMLQKAGCELEFDNDSCTVKSSGKLDAIPLIETQPYPLFPTDLQPQIAVAQCVSIGTSVIVENLFESRSKHFAELKKMGADILVNNKIAVVKGKEKLFGATVSATDLRAGASLVLAGLKAEGYSTIEYIEHILRGYQDFDKNLQKLGADIQIIED